jgi:acetoin utilization protein AcuB
MARAKVISMNVIEIMTASPITIRSNQCLRDALELMDHHYIKHLPVIGNHHVVGVVTERDCRRAFNAPFLRGCLYDQKIATHVMVRSVMSSELVVVAPDTPAIEAVQLILTHHIGCLPVLREETLIGIITRTDLLIAFIILQRRFDRLPDALNYDEAHAPATSC